MALTLNGKRIGRAAHEEKRDFMENIYAQDRKARSEARLQLEQELIIAADSFDPGFGDWYASDAVPEFGPVGERIRLIEQRMAGAFAEAIKNPA